MLTSINFNISPTVGQGNSGDITIIAEDNVNFDGEFSNGSFVSSAQTLVGVGASGNAGNINITTNSLSLTNGGQLQTATDGIGNAGNVNIVADFISLDGMERNERFSSSIFSDVGASGVGNGGDINITTTSLSLTNGGQLVADTDGQGGGGNIKINARQQVSFDGVGKNRLTSSAFTRVDFGAVGNGGNIEVVTESLSLSNGAQLIANTRGKGDAGIISIDATEKVSFDGNGIGLSGGELQELSSGVFNEVVSEATGQGNLITINTPLLVLSNDAQINATTSGQGKAGSIEVTANIFEATKNGKILTSTFNSFNAGNINLNIKDKLTLSGSESGIFANTTENSTGKGGNIIIDPQTVTIRDGATIAVNSEGSGTGGSITLAAEELTLDSGSITAETVSNQGGNITLNIQDLLSFINSGEITATAGTAQAGGDGGNIGINSDFIVGFPTQEQYRITANAFEGNGGKIDITTNAIFGAEFFDISASSELGLEGEISINTPDINPLQGLDNLPTEVVDASQLIAKRCLAGEGETAEQQSEFTITGRGGLPTNPNESLRGDAILSPEWVSLDSEIEEERRKRKADEQTSIVPPQIVQATGWVIRPDGKISLTAHNPNSISPSPGINHPQCHAAK